MRRAILRAGAPANILALIAIVIACSSSAYAAVRITSAQVKDNTLQSRDIANRTVQRIDLAADVLVPKVVTRTESDLGYGPVHALCEPGEIATGGGGATINMQVSEPILDEANRPIGWTVEGKAGKDYAATNGGTGPQVIGDPNTTARVICSRA